jgi:tetratricopeptide (TPR) repeat protein
MVLVEREHELGRLEAAIAEAASGQGSSVIIEGPPGIGKTALLDHTRELAETAGMRVLSTSAAELENDFGFSVIRGLFEPVLAGLNADERSTLFGGAARLATGPLGLDDGPTPPVELGSAIHGIYWLCANLADRGPMLLAVDDLHWADEPSLLFLSYLARRATEHPLLICVTMRPADDEPAEKYRGALRSAAGDVLRPEPLSDAGVARLVADMLSADAAPEFWKACAHASGGNPFLLIEALSELRHDGVEPTAAEAGRLGDLRPETLARSLLARLARLGPVASRVANAVAILGADADLRRVALVAETDPQAVADAVSGLRREGILAPDARLGFTHPLIRHAVYSHISEPQRGLGHLHAAKILDGDGMTARVAPHLLVAERHGDPWVVALLREAADTALAGGTPASAAALLDRASTEPCDESDRPAIGVELGRALARAGDLDAAGKALGHAHDLVDDPVQSAAIALELGRVLRLAGRIPEAVAVLDQASERLVPEAHHDEAIALEAEIALASHMGRPAKEWVDRLAAVADRAPGTSLPDRTVRSIYSYVAAATGTRDATAVARLAHSSIAPSGMDPPQLLQLAAAGLAMSGALTEALSVLDRAVRTTQELGDASQFGFVCLTRTWVAHRAGRVRESEADARAVFTIAADSPVYGPYGVASLVITLIERNALDEAEELLATHGLAETTGVETALAASLYAVRGRLRRVRGRAKEGLADIERCRDVVNQLGFTSPHFMEWRTEAALCHLALGDRDLAREVASEDLALSRAFGAPREIGFALRIAGMIEGGAPGLELHAESVHVLADSEAELDHAKSLVELGAALRRDGKRADAQDRLRTVSTWPAAAAV